jgi:hypothetical protein
MHFTIHVEWLTQVGFAHVEWLTQVGFAHVQRLVEGFHIATHVA